jgi:hypothetical protein
MQVSSEATTCTQVVGLDHVPFLQRYRLRSYFAYAEGFDATTPDSLGLRVQRSKHTASQPAGRACKSQAAKRTFEER